MKHRLHNTVLLMACLILLLCIEVSMKKYEAFVDKEESGHSDNEAITVMTYNIRHGVGVDDRLNLDRIIETIKIESPDIVVLNEVDNLMPRSLMQKQDEIIASKLRYNHIYGYNLNLGSKYGNALYTKHTIKEWVNRTLPKQGGVLVEPRGLIEANIEVRGEKLNVFATHLSLKKEERIVQMRYIIERLEQTPGHKLLLGDFNAEPISNEMKTIFPLMRDCTDSGAKTYPSKSAKSKIDYIFISEKINLLEAKVLQSIASDHLPVVAKIEFE